MLGIKTGLVGVHFWLAPVFVVALPALRPALIGSLLGAGLLGWLRLLPLGLAWIAALLLVAAPVGIAGSLAKFGGMAAVQVSWAMAAVAFLAVRGLLSIA